MLILAACSSKTETKAKPEGGSTATVTSVDAGDARTPLARSIEETFRRAGFAAKFSVRDKTLVLSNLSLNGDDACHWWTVGALLAPAKPNIRIALRAPAIEAGALQRTGFTRVECEDPEGRVYGEDLPLKPDRTPPPMREGAIEDPALTDISFSVTTTWDKALANSSNDDAVQAMVDLYLYCKSATKVAADTLDDLWHTARSVTAKGTSVVEDSVKKPVWEIRVDFDERRKNLHKGKALRYRLDERRENIFALDALSGELCDVPAEKWSKL